MQFILTLLISVRGRELLKDGSNLSFSGKEVGLTDTQARLGGPGWTGSRAQVWWGVWDVVSLGWTRRRREQLKPKLQLGALSAWKGALCLVNARHWHGGVCVLTRFLKISTILVSQEKSCQPHCSLLLYEAVQATITKYRGLGGLE